MAEQVGGMCKSAPPPDSGGCSAVVRRLANCVPPKASSAVSTASTMIGPRLSGLSSTKCSTVSTVQRIVAKKKENRFAADGT